MRTQRKWIVSVLIIGVLACIGIPTVLISQQLRQDNLDHALILAVKKLDAPSVTRLLDQGANANARDTGGPSLTIHSLLMRLWLRMQHKPISSGTNTSALGLLLTDAASTASIIDNLASVDSIAVALIEHGGDFHVPVVDGTIPPLEVAVTLGMHKTVRTLLSKGADANCTDDRGFTPLMCSRSEDSKLLLEYGADVNARNLDGETPLYLVLASSTDQVRLLVEHGANVNASIAGRSILCWAMFMQRSPSDKAETKAAIIRLLKQHGARLNQKDTAALAASRIHAP